MAESSKTDLHSEQLSSEDEQVLAEPPSLDDDFFEDPSLDWAAPDSTTEMPFDYAAKAMRSARLRELKRSLVKRREGAGWTKPDSTEELPKGYAESILDGMVDVAEVAPGGWEEPDNTSVMAGVHVQRLLDSADEEEEALAEAPPDPPPEAPTEAQTPTEEAAEDPPAPIVKREKPLEKPGLDAESVFMMTLAAVLLLTVVGLMVYSLAAILLG